MKLHYISFLSLATLLVSALLLLAISAKAQDATIDLKILGSRTENGVTVTYRWYEDGANIYGENNPEWGLRIESERPLVRIEFEGTTNKGGGLSVSEGTLDFSAHGTSVWTGKTTNLKVVGSSSATDYYIPVLYIWFEGTTQLCEVPSMVLQGGNMYISSGTDGAVCHYEIQPNPTAKSGRTQEPLQLSEFQLRTYAATPGLRPSMEVTRTFSFDELAGNQAAAIRTLSPAAAKRKEDEERSFERKKVLVEKHTGLQCQYCPVAETYLAGYKQRHPEVVDRMIVVRHNSYSADQLSVQGFHRDLSSAWSVSGWPKFFIDRADYHGGQYATANGYQVSYNEFSAQNFDAVGKRLAVPTYVDLSLEGSSYDPKTGRLDIHVSGDVVKDVPDLCINIYLTQSNIYGRGDSDEAYNKSTRAFLTKSLHGDALDVVGGRYDVSYSHTIQERYGSIKAAPEDMSVVVFVSSYDNYAMGPKDFTNSQVHNAEEINITDLPLYGADPCEQPAVSLKDGTLNFTSGTPNATFNYSLKAIPGTVSPDDDVMKLPAFELSVYATAPDYNTSPIFTQVFTLSDVAGTEENTTSIQATSASLQRTAAAQVYDLQGRAYVRQPQQRGIYLKGSKKSIGK